MAGIFFTFFTLISKFLNGCGLSVSHIATSMETLCLEYKNNFHIWYVRQESIKGCLACGRDNFDQSGPQVTNHSPVLHATKKLKTDVLWGSTCICTQMRTHIISISVMIASRTAVSWLSTWGHTHTRGSSRDVPFSYLETSCCTTSNTNSDLTHHIQTHTGEVPYNCEFCDHSKYQIKPESSYQSEPLGQFCDFVIISTADLREHHKTHGGVQCGLAP